MTRIRDLQSADYRKLRDELLEAEVALKDQRERVALLRRQLPRTDLTTDYVFQEGPADLSRNDPSEFFQTRLSELFGDRDVLLVQHMMLAPEWERGCPMCSMWTDGFAGIAHHIDDAVNFVVVARAPLAKLRNWGRQRGWGRLRLLSSAENEFNPDFGTEISPDRQLPAFSVFTREPDDRIQHFYTSEGSLVESHHRAMDLLTPIWNMLDLLPEGRGSWMPQHFYGEA